jgi:hypothetical protein
MRVVLSTPAVMSFVSVWKAAALATAQVGAAVFFVSGMAASALGPGAAWVVLAATLLGWCARAIDVESWALLIPGGTNARVQQAFGPGAGRAAAAVGILERLVFASLAAVVIGHYLAPVMAPRIGSTIAWAVAGQELAAVIGVAVIGVLWMRARIGLTWRRDAMARLIWLGLAIVVVGLVWAALSLHRAVMPSRALLDLPPLTDWSAGAVIEASLFWLAGLSLALPATGGGDALANAAHEFAPPRLKALQRTRLLVGFLTLALTASSAFLFVLLVPASEYPLSSAAPLTGLAAHVAGPGWTRALLDFAIVAAAVLILAPALHLALTEAEGLLQRLSLEGTLSKGFAELHQRLGTPVRLIDMTAAGAVAAVFLAGGRSDWLAHAYAITLAASMAIKVATLIRLRRTTPGAPYRTPLTLRVGRLELALGLAGTAIVFVAAALAAIVTGDPPSIAAAALLSGCVLLLPWVARRADGEDAAADERPLDILSTSDVSIEQLHIRPGGVLAPVRNPHLLDHVAAALKSAGDRDVVVMTVRVAGADDDFSAPANHSPTSSQEQRLFAEVMAMAERLGRPVHLLVVPARHVVDAIVTTILRLQASDVFVGESSTLSAAAQAQLLGDAWERADRPDASTVRLIVAHRSGPTCITTTSFARH